MRDAAQTGRLLAWLRAPLAEHEGDEPLRLYALLDGARDPRIAPMLRASGAPWRCLFDGDLDPELAAAAPYIVELAADAAFTRTLVAAAWGEAWGVFATATAELEPLRGHFRRFLRVVDEQRRPLLFRFYDPRVLRIYLPTCNYAELLQVFGPVREFLLEGEEPGRALRLGRGDGELAVAVREP